jgi:tetratricopeptide (TPR) repeat protein
VAHPPQFPGASNAFLHPRNTQEEIMKTPVCSKCLAAASLLLIAAAWGREEIAQTPAPPPAKAAITSDKPADYSQEALVVEQLRVNYRFEKDGTGTHDMALRVRLQSEAALEEFGQLVLPYVSANEKLDIDYVRVKKPDGRIIAASPTDVQDLTAPISREAPVYTDTRQKHITVPGLRPGDVLEYHAVWQVNTPLAPNNFWMNYDFTTKKLIVLDEQLEVNIPQDTVVKLKTEKGFDPKITEASGRRIYTWKHAVLKHEEEKDDEKQAARKRKEESEDPKPPQVQMTTFNSWDDVGKWYADLERDRIVPDEKVKAKAEEIVSGLNSDREKIKALYEYVAKNFRYVSLSLGQGRYQPHAAASVFANQYGDCKDKHTLFSAMLQAAGYKAYPALMNSSRAIDGDVPSPAQFDHVISAIPLNGELWWADTTAEVAPFRLLSPPLRDKKALLIPNNAPARLETTPAEPPFVSTESIDVSAKVSDLGKLVGTGHMIFRGDAELYYRIIFRRTPRSDWKRLGRVLAATIGDPNAEVTDINPSDVAALEKPFEVNFNFSEDSFLDWSTKKANLDLPLPSLHLADIDEETVKPIKLGVPMDLTYSLKLVLPSKYSARAPLPVALNRDYATYASKYQFDGNTLTAVRTLHLRQREIPSARAQDWIAFASAEQADEAQTLAVETDVAGTPAIPDSVKVDDLLEAAQAALRNNNYDTAESLLRRVLEKEPKHKTVRRELAYALFAQQKFDEAIDVLREQARMNPFDNYANSLMGRIFWMQQKYPDAEAAFRKQLEIAPLDKETHGMLGLMLVEWRKYNDAVPELEQAISLNPDHETEYQVNLGRAYLNLNQNEKALASFDRAIKISPGQRTWNDIAYFLAVSNVQLDKAQQYAESAVTEIETDLRNADLSQLRPEDLQNVAALAANWDTLGWVYFKKGDLSRAEKYISAAWLLEQHGEVGYHLGQIYEKNGKQDAAIRMYAQAAGSMRTVPEAAESLERLVGKEKTAALLKKGDEETRNSRTVFLNAPALNAKAATQARFYVTLTPGAGGVAQVTDVKFITGDEKLKPAGDLLKTGKFGFVFPGAGATKVIRRGTLSCAGSGQCSFIMMSPDAVTSIDQ